jgi:hypothetical protein
MRYEDPVRFRLWHGTCFVLLRTVQKILRSHSPNGFLGLEKVAYEKQIHIEFGNFRAGTGGRTFDELAGTNH